MPIFPEGSPSLTGAPREKRPSYHAQTVIGARLRDFRKMPRIARRYDGKDVKPGDFEHNAGEILFRAHADSHRRRDTRGSTAEDWWNSNWQDKN